MAYSSLADLKKLIPEEALLQLTDDENAGMVNSTRIDEAIAQADAEIDAYLGGIYAVPMSPVPDVVKKVSVDMAIYHLYSRRVEEIPKTRDDRYKRAVKILEDIVSGKIPSIGEATEPAAAATADQGPRVSTSADDRIFTKDKLKGF